ncbi:hypothetical protein KEM56_006889 [Ascosphaera pollenicola]|nr:hypothetical protein KEM56_006889 [Ascosphaera pollenicola]
MKQPLTQWRTVEKYHVLGKHVPDLSYDGEVVIWRTFESTVKNTLKAFQEATPSANVGIFHESIDPSMENSKQYCHFICGNETSVNSVYGHTALDVANSIGQSLGLTSQYGDIWASSSRKSGIPDFMLLDLSRRNKVVAVGEGKAPFDVMLSMAWQAYFFPDSVPIPDQSHWAKLNGYLAEYGVNFGFLTDIDSTIFIRKTDDKLYCSRPIPYTQESGESTLSAREGMVFLQVMNLQDHGCMIRESSSSVSQSGKKRHKPVDLAWGDDGAQPKLAETVTGRLRKATRRSRR